MNFSKKIPVETFDFPLLATPASESVPSDEVHEKAVNLATMVYQLEGEGNMAQFVPFYEHTSQMVKVALLNTKRVSPVNCCQVLLSLLTLD